MTPESEKGDLVFEARRGCLTLLLGLAGLIIGPPLLAFGLETSVKVGGGIAFAAGLLLIPIGVRLRGRVFRCYGNGIEYDDRFVLYDDIASMQARVVTTHSEMGTGTDYSFRFEGSNSEGPFVLKFRSGNLGRRADRADFLIATAGRAIAQRMHAELANTGLVAWTHGVVLRQDSLQSEKMRAEVPYVRLRVASFRNGRLVLRGADGFKEVISSTERNFFPGYFVLLDKIQGQVDPD